MRATFFVRVAATPGVRPLRRILRRFFSCLLGGIIVHDFGSRSVALHGRLEVLVRRHQVVPHGDAGRVAQPLCDRLHRMLFDQFRFPAGPQVLEQPGPRRQTGPLYDFLERRPQVGVHPAGRTIRRLAELFIDHIHRAIRRQLEGFVENRPQLGKQRNRAARLAGMVLGLRRCDDDPVGVPINVLPAEREHFAGAPQAAEAGQGDYRLPVMVGTGSYDEVDFFSRNKPLPILNAHGCRLHAVEWILVDQLSSPYGVEE